MKYLAVWLGLMAPFVSAQRWNVQYFYDQDRATLAFEDLAFPSAKRGIAVGTIYEQFKKPRFATLITSDGGEHWSVEPVKEHPRSLFFLNESMGWMVTDDGIWFSEESGRSWKRISGQPKPDRKLRPATRGGLILRVWFLDAQHGFSVGLQKSVFETRDGGRTWAPVAAAATPSANPAFTAYTRIAFDTPKVGMIIGAATPPRRDDAGSLPSWMDPEVATKRREIPRLTILLQTKDGGNTWEPSTAPMFGAVTSLRLSGIDGLAVLGFNDSFEWPSEVQWIDLTTGKSTSAFREKNRRVLDSALFPGPRMFLAAVEPPGRLNTTPIPGKVKILTSSNFTDWTEMDVDYKAVARFLVMAGPDAEHLWCATDTGMILHLKP